MGNKEGGNQWRRDRLGLRGSFRRRLGNYTRSDVLLFSIGKWCGMERDSAEREERNREKKEKEEPRRGHTARFRTNTTQTTQSNQRKQAIISAAQPEGIRGDRHERTHTHNTFDRNTRVMSVDLRAVSWVHRASWKGPRAARESSRMIEIHS